MEQWSDTQVLDYFRSLNNDRPRGRGPEVAHHRAWRREELKRLRQEMKRRKLAVPAALVNGAVSGTSLPRLAKSKVG